MSDQEPSGNGGGRILSMDQFRGYTVAGMFLVNFLGGYAAIHPVFKHNNTLLQLCRLDHAELHVRRRLLLPADECCGGWRQRRARARPAGGSCSGAWRSCWSR